MSDGALLLLVSGPAGSGKTTLCQRLLEAHSGIERVVTATTRAPRQGEMNGRDYHFLEETDFESKVRAGQFYEHALVHGRHYGVLRAEVDRRLEAGVDLLLNIDVQGAASFRRSVVQSGSLAAELVTVFLMPQSIAQIRERLRSRGTDGPDEIERRLKVAEEEMLERDYFQHVIVTGERDADFQRLEAIYLAEKARRR